MVILVLASSFSLIPDKVTQGDIIYSFKAGQIQCLSEIDGKGQLAILLKVLTDNTKIEFDKLKQVKDHKSLKEEYILELNILVEDTEICAS